MPILDALLKKTAGAITTPSPGMRRAIATAHTAAYYAALKERTGVLPKGLSRAERAELKAAIEGQLRYLDKFSEDARGMSEQAILARAQKYVGAIRTTFLETRWGAWDIPPDLMPGRQACQTACGCDISIQDNGDGTGTLTRTMGGKEKHCVDCPPLAGDHPVKRRAA
jgi:hypothetical protein